MMSALRKWLVPGHLFHRRPAVQEIGEDRPCPTPQPIFPHPAGPLAVAEVIATPPADPPEPVASRPDDGDLALVSREEGLFVRGPAGRYQPLRWHHGGAQVQSLLPGWRATWICDDFRPVRLVELEGPDDHLATWFIDEAGNRLGDKVLELSRIHQDCLAAGLTRLLSDRDPTTAATLRYGRVCPMTRLQIESLLPNATYDRAMELAQAIAALPGAAMREQARIEAVIAVSPARLAPELVEGWRLGDLHGRVACIAVGHGSLIRLSGVPRSGAYYVELGIGPLRLSRRLRVVVNGRAIAVNPLSGIFHRDRARFGYWIPPELVTLGAIEIKLEHALISRASDEAFVLEHVRLDVAAPVGEGQAETTSTDGELMLRFQSLGDNCQFGFVQRHFGIEPISLLRFAGVPDLTGMIASGLRELGRPGTVGYFMAGREYMIREASYSIFYHTFKHVEEISPDQLIAENETKLQYLARKFMEDLEDGETIWVSRRIVSNDISEIAALHAAMRRYGPNRLLWITPAPHDRRPGEVEWLGADLLRGYLAPDASNDPHRFDPDHYRLLCRNADQAFRSRRAIPGPSSSGVLPP